MPHSSASSFAMISSTLVHEYDERFRT